LLFQLLKRFSMLRAELLTEEKQRLGRLYFEDIPRALLALDGPESPDRPLFTARLYELGFHRTAHLLLDEFQDTSRIQFDLLRPLDEGSIDFTIQVKASDDINLNETNLQVTSRAKATAAKIGELDAIDLAIESNEITSNINTDVELKVEGRYFTADNIPVGSGPLPPVVGQTTTFRIYWSIANSLHEVGDVTVSATLPHGVAWASKLLAKVGSLRYNQSDQTVTWTIPSINPNEGFDDTNAWFDVSVTPTKDQAKKLLILSGQASLTATDEVTDAAISKVGKAITSNLDDDPIGGGKGLVVEIAE